MAIKDVQAYIDRHGLVETEDSEAGKPIWRKPDLAASVASWRWKRKSAAICASDAMRRT
jgi:hypothetical protein